MSRRFTPIKGATRPVQWGILVSLSLVFAWLLEHAAVPAALLLGPMMAAILLQVWGGSIRVPSLPQYCAQAAVGCLIASAVTPAIIGTFVREWPLFLGVVLATVVASSALGWTLSRWQVLPGTTAVWGLAPGGAIAMMLTAEAFGADGRLVAIMQYLRVVLVALAAAAVARFWVGAPEAAVDSIWFPAIHWRSLAETLGVAAIGGVLGRALRIPAGALLVPMMTGGFLQATALAAIELPPSLLALSYAVLGWSTGLLFTRQILIYAARALPQITLATLALIIACGGVAYILVEALGIDPLTAFLATSPGSMDAVAIIAASSNSDVAFVMAFQTVRFLTVVFVAPPLALFLANHLKRGRGGE